MTKTRTAVLNQKGGVGKTAVSLNLAGALAEAGHSVTVVDLDPQGHLTAALGLGHAEGEASLARALTGDWAGSFDDLAVEHSTTDGGGVLKVVPTSFEMFLVGRTLDQQRAREHRLSRLVESCTSQHLIIDCPPALDILSDNALVAATQAVIPVQAEDSTLQALRLFLDQVSAVDRDLRSTPLHLVGMVVNLVRRPLSTLARSVLDELNQLPGLPVIAQVPQGVVMQEAWRVGKPVVAYAPNTEHADVFRDLAKIVHSGGVDQ